MDSKPEFRKISLKALEIVVFSAILGIAYNLFFPGGIPLVGSWSKQILESGVVVPPSYQKEIDAPAISVKEAMELFNSGKVKFIDARAEEDYKKGHIPKSINLYQEEFDVHYEKVRDKISPEDEVVTYCGGEDCELSLFLARLLAEKGYKKIKIFFGGWEQWKEAGLPVVK